MTPVRKAVFCANNGKEALSKLVIISRINQSVCMCVCMRVCTHMFSLSKYFIRHKKVIDFL